MNVLFHTTTAIGIAVGLSDTRTTNIQQIRNNIQTSSVAFIIGIIAHGALDYIPHCYPINSKMDVALGLTIMLAFSWFVSRPYKLIIFSGFLGSLFPDIVDHLPNILNRHLDFNLPVGNKIFPWHWSEYSGSIYSGICNVSTVNHVLLLFTIGVVCWYRRTDLKNFFLKEES